jgi:hypothetical protein
MSADAAFCWAAAIAIASMAGCVAVTAVSKHERDKAMTPQQRCVELAWSQADRIECLKTGAPR